MLKQKITGSVQEVILPEFPDDDDNTVTTTVTKSRRVSFGPNFVKEFIVDSAISAQYEQPFPSSDSSNADTTHGTFVLQDNLKLHKSDSEDNRPKPPKFASTICFSADSPTADMEFTEGCITLAKSILDKKNKEMTVFIQAKAKGPKEEEKTSEGETNHFEGSQFEMSTTMQSFKSKEKKRFAGEKTKIFGKSDDEMSVTRCERFYADEDEDEDEDESKENRMPLDAIMRYLDKNESDSDLFNPEKPFGVLLGVELSDESEKLDLNESMELSEELNIAVGRKASGVPSGDLSENEPRRRFGSNHETEAAECSADMTITESPNGGCLDVTEYKIHFGEVSSEEMMGEELVRTEEIVSERLIARELVLEKIRSEEMISEKMRTEEVLAEKITHEILVTEKIMIEETVTKEVPEKMSTEEIMPEEAVPSVRTEEMLAEKIIPENLVTGKIMVEEMVTEKIMVEEMVTKEVPKKMSTEKIMPEETVPNLRTEEMLAEKIIPENLVTEKIMPEETVPNLRTEEIMPEETVPNLRTEEIMPEETVPNLRTEEIMSEETVPNLRTEMLAEKIIPENLVTEKIMVEEMVTKEVPEKMSTEEIMPEEMVTKEVPEKMSTDKISTEEITSNKTRTDKIFTEILSEKITSQETLPEETLTEDLIDIEPSWNPPPFTRKPPPASPKESIAPPEEEDDTLTEPTLGDLKVVESLKEQAKESGCVWTLRDVQHPRKRSLGLLSFSCRLLDSTTSLRFSLRMSDEDTLDCCSSVTDSSVLLDEDDECRVPEYTLAVAFGYQQLKKHLGTLQGVANLRHVPYYMDRVNSFLSRMNGYLRQIQTVLTSYPGSRLQGCQLSFRLFSFPVFLSCVVSIDLSDVFRLSRASLSFEHDFGCLDEKKVEEMFEKSLKEEEDSLCGFVVRSTRYLVEEERKLGYVSKRRHIRLLPEELKC